MTVYRRRKSPYFWYDFTILSQRYRGSTKTRDLLEAKKFEKQLKGRIRVDLMGKVVRRRSDNHLRRLSISAAWKRVRYRALLRSKGKCELCGRGKAQDAILNVDHIKPKAHYPHLALNIDNLQVLCEECNNGKGAWDVTDWRTQNNSENGTYKSNVAHAGNDAQ